MKSPIKVGPASTYGCPKCKKACFSTIEEALACCSDPESPARVSASSPCPKAPSETGVQNRPSLSASPLMSEPSYGCFVCKRSGWPTVEAALACCRSKPESEGATSANEPTKSEEPTQSEEPTTGKKATLSEPSSNAHVKAGYCCPTCHTGGWATAIEAIDCCRKTASSKCEEVPVKPDSEHDDISSTTASSSAEGPSSSERAGSSEFCPTQDAAGHGEDEVEKLRPSATPEPAVVQVGYRCPTCSKGGWQSAAEAVSCCNGQGPSITATDSEEAKAPTYCCPRCNMGGWPTAVEALDCCKPKTEVAAAVPGQSATVDATDGPASEPTSTLGYQCPTCSKGGWNTVEEAMGCCPKKRRASSETQNVPAAPTHFEETPGDIEAREERRKNRPAAAGYKCPVCGQGQLENLEEAMAHCDFTIPKAQSRSRVISEYKCPGCGESADSLESALKHCNSELASLAAEVLAQQSKETVVNTEWVELDDDDPLISPKHSQRATASEHQRLEVLPPAGDVVACDDAGRPVITRVVDSETGVAQTLVKNDSVERAFGEKTVLSLLDSPGAASDKWLRSMAKVELHGLCHEVKQRIADQSTAYHAKVRELEAVVTQLNLAFFGITEETSLRELEILYRSLAKKLHPDKNGGTPEAKDRFQQMKERFVALRKSMLKQVSVEGEVVEEVPMEHLGFGGCIEDRPAQEKDEQKPDQDRDTCNDVPSDEIKEGQNYEDQLAFDSNDSESMHEALAKMVSQLQNIRSKGKTVDQELAAAAKQAACPPTVFGS